MLQILYRDYEKGKEKDMLYQRNIMYGYIDISVLWLG